MSSVPPTRPTPDLPPEVVRTLRRLDSALFLFHLGVAAGLVAAVWYGIAELVRLWSAMP